MDHFSLLTDIQKKFARNIARKFQYTKNQNHIAAKLPNWSSSIFSAFSQINCDGAQNYGIVFRSLIITADLLMKFTELNLNNKKEFYWHKTLFMADQSNFGERNFHSRQNFKLVKNWPAFLVFVFLFVASVLGLLVVSPFEPETIFFSLCDFQIASN